MLYRRAARTLLVTVLLAAGLGAQAPQELPAVSPIPAAEQFVQGTGLRVRLTMRKTSLDAFEDPGFVAILENVGTTPLLLNPYVASDIRIYDERAALVDPPLTLTAELLLALIANDHLKELAPASRWEVPLSPEYPRVPGDLHFRAPYVGVGRAAENGLALAAGRYTARFTYVNVPGYTAQYDVLRITGIWEGRVESEPVEFTMAGEAEAMLEALRPSRERAWAAATIPELEQQLAGDDNRLFNAATDRLIEIESRQSLPLFRKLTDDPVPWKRWAAASAIARLAGAEAPALMRELMLHDDPGVVGRAVARLASSCELSDAPLFERAVRMRLGSDAVRGLVACGTAESFATLRSLPDALEASAALHALTFTPSPVDATGHSQRVTLAEWDAWIAMHGDETREEWAIRALTAPDRAWVEMGAIDHLRRANDPRALPAARRVASDTSYETRIAAARAVAAFERSEGMALLRRELLNRRPDAVRKAIDALNAVTGQNLQFDVTVPSERQRALEAYVP